MFTVNGITFNDESPIRGETSAARNAIRAVAAADNHAHMSMSNQDAVRAGCRATELPQGANSARTPWSDEVPLPSWTAP